MSYSHIIDAKAFLDSVEHVAWEEATALLGYEDLRERVGDFGDVAGQAGVLLAVPAVRQVMLRMFIYVLE